MHYTSNFKEIAIFNHISLALDEILYMAIIRRRLVTEILCGNSSRYSH